ncbi:MAG: adenylate/guanylate cyclase domain-containing protein [Chloroflexota bacterium]|nr:adenylate/guanylate cyclase domain-containing protein [Chloroflexota bacterium]
MTVLFADVISSTALGDQLDPERLRALLVEYFAAMSAVIGSWGGTLEKYIGDAIMAVFGAPLVREDDAERALHAALEMLARLESVNEELLRRHAISLRIRIGINTGEVVAPQGGATSGQLIVSGDAVNVAARLEQAADPGTVLVGERTYLAARHAFEFGNAAHLSVKGKPEPIPARRLWSRDPRRRGAYRACRRQWSGGSASWGR